MNTKDDIQKLVLYIEENTRASKGSGISFIDPRNYKTKLLLRQNHVIFGRRGAGKTSLVNTVRNDCDKKAIVVYVNLEDFKDISFPNILLNVLVLFFRQIKKELITRELFKPISLVEYLSISQKIRKTISKFKGDLEVPDNFDETIKEKGSSELTGNLKFSEYSTTIGVGAKDKQSIETEKVFHRNKLESIKNSITAIKQILFQIEKLVGKKSIFLILDDFYFVPKLVQPFFIDFFHRLSKDTELFLKVATIKHRTKLYTQLESTYFGTEVGHDIQEIDLDYTLDRFEELKNFMLDIIHESSKASNAEIDILSIFSETGFPQLCLASGGVPRDFLILMNRLLSNFKPESSKISKYDVNEIAIENIGNKYSSFKTDSAEEKEVLEQYLSFIQNFVIGERRTNIFLVANRDLESYPQVRQAINELLDLRMFHLVEPNTSAAPSDGRTYTAYMIDIGLYPSARLREFNQIEPGISDNKGRKDEIRSSPRLDINKITETIAKRPGLITLEITT